MVKAAQIKQYGGPDVIEIVDIEKPKPDTGQVLVKVYASSINPFDIKLRQGVFKESIPLNFPFTLGGDIAGVINAIGENVEGFSVGNNVYGSANVLSGATGAFAEFAAVPTSNLAKMPKNLDFNQSAAVVLTGVSAVQALVEHIKLQQDQKILIHGGAGGIGTVAIQIAKAVGAYVATTATGQGVDFVKKLGADYVIDYKKVNFIDLVSDYDAVFDTVGGEVFEHSFKVLKKGPARIGYAEGVAGGGIIVSMIAKDEKKLADQYNVTIISQFTKVNQEHLNMLTDFIERGKVKPYIDKIYSFDKIRDAFDYKENEEVLGKIVIQIKN